MEETIKPAHRIAAIMLVVASMKPDIDDAVGYVMKQVGITDGDVADMAIGEHRDAWPTATQAQRHQWLSTWAEAERNAADRETLAPTRSVKGVISQAQYKKNPMQCPVCRSANIRSGDIDVEGTKATQELWCMEENCHAEWIDKYGLIGYTLIVDGEGNDVASDDL